MYITNQCFFQHPCPEILLYIGLSATLVLLKGFAEVLRQFPRPGRPRGLGELGLADLGTPKKGGDPVSSDRCGLVEVASLR